MCIKNMDQLELPIQNYPHFHPLLNWLDSQKTKYQIELIRIAKDKTKSQYTKNTKEILLIAEGNGGIAIDEEVKLIKSGEIIYVRPNSLRSLISSKNNNLEVLSIQAIE